MPTTDKTWRDQKAMHVVFGVSSVVLLLSTIWMLAVDHNRPYKEPMRVQQRINELFSLMMRDEVDTAIYRARRDEKQAELDAARAEV
ncbi:MAG: hypothetical protein IIA45_09920, partial [Bacteroidetes bacterium]|nr:hypothetical protein [Bacteroidota bacterium]